MEEGKLVGDLARNLYPLGHLISEYGEDAFGNLQDSCHLLNLLIDKLDNAGKKTGVILVYLNDPQKNRFYPMGYDLL